MIDLLPWVQRFLGALFEAAPALGLVPHALALCHQTQGQTEIAHSAWTTQRWLHAMG